MEWGVESGVGGSDLDGDGLASEGERVHVQVIVDTDERKLDMEGS